MTSAAASERSGQFSLPPATYLQILLAKAFKLRAIFKDGLITISLLMSFLYTGWGVSPLPLFVNSKVWGIDR
jgi:hypothetical protein